MYAYVCISQGNAILTAQHGFSNANKVNLTTAHKLPADVAQQSYVTQAGSIRSQPVTAFLIRTLTAKKKTTSEKSHMIIFFSPHTDKSWQSRSGQIIY